MHTVTILGFDQAYASAITGALDLFSLTGVTWERMQHAAISPKFNVQLASKGGLPIKCINGITLESHIAIEDVMQTDVLLIPTIGGHIDNVLSENKRLMQYIRHHYLAGADIASNCSGAFFLAEAGLLTDKEATTHWGYADVFRSRYPDVNLLEEQMITQSDRLFCSGGGMAWFDLALLLIERYCGYQVASQVAKSHILEISRGTQAAYAHIRSKKFHQDEEILQAQEYIEAHYSHALPLSLLPEKLNLAPRTFLRRFKQATRTTPSDYLKTVRLEAAKKLLEFSSDSTELIVNQVGYEDASSFIRLFKRHTGLSPGQYRKKFQRLAR
ncbi:helix-turn-helix domain-containing protein [Aestuariibacter sp. AA17]|uniref:Helix-turn-helix domain-containing protein n=1 Tax=Fluctibacter corallii TaxID=2984329 RepID=A0ABT3A5R1_9ALTE|nr:helix-turn-helix domain-containing protein [Aestuariibacter sp. AA17]MCV2883948.1 helix-turn-helix domain-containing protein [Aestuariibacter sp. AA17]